MLADDTSTRHVVVWRKSLYTPLGLAIGLTLVGIAFSRGSPLPVPESAAPGPGIGYPLDLPVFPEAQPVSLAAAQGASGGVLILPHAANASAANIQQVWLNSTYDEVEIYFASGLRLLESPAPQQTQATIQAEWELAVQQNDGASQLQTINGTTAFVTARDYPGNGQCGTPGVDCIPPSQNPSDVALILDGTFVELSADWPLDQVITVADTLSTG